MSFNEIVAKCTSLDSEYKDTDCSKTAFISEYLNTVNENSVKAAMTTIKPGDTLELKTLDTLTPTQDKFMSVYQEQITWDRPYKKAIEDLPATLDKMAPGQARKYVDDKLKEAAKVKAPGEDQYPQLDSNNDPTDPFRNLGFNTPFEIASRNERMAESYPGQIRHAAIDYFDKHKRYDDVRELAMGLPAGYDRWVSGSRESYLARPEIAISSAQQKRIVEIFDKLDHNGNGELSKSELEKALKSDSLSAQDKEIVQLLSTHREKMALANDDSILFKEKSISREDLKHIGRVVKDQPGAFFDSLDDGSSGTDGLMNPITLMMLR